ncbi:MAG: hypothetical protein ACI93R_002103 [Flavobacteriales bacterium]|jgi:hypothetical protein
MSSTISGKGRCLCGEVRFEANKAAKSIGACHCTMCLKWGGGPFMAVDCGADIRFDGQENLTIFKSSDWAERGYCNKCGSHLFYRFTQGMQHMMAAGLFDDNSMFTFDHQVFIDKKPSYYCFSNETTDTTGEEEFTKYAALSD